jgi:phosphoribosyl 1,2-cyclic phosphate phosphodiesterase
MFTHLDPDHIEGIRVVEQIALDFRSWTAYPAKQIELLLPKELEIPMRRISSQYGSVLDFYERSGLVRLHLFDDFVDVKDVRVRGLAVDRGSQVSFVYVFEHQGRRVVYAPCDLKPFPEHRHEVYDADLLVIQPGMFEGGLKHGFVYPADHISRRTLYTFSETLELAQRLRAEGVLCVHLEEYWNRSYDDYRTIECTNKQLRFAYDGMRVFV